MEKIRIGIIGCGNLGRGVEMAVAQNPDMELVGVFTRREPSAVCTVETKKIFPIKDVPLYKDKIDVMILCGGSATDLKQQSPQFAADFNIVDSFDTHAKIPEHFAAVNNAASESGHVAIISAGWDPGLFSINRLIAEAVLPCGKSYTFWGCGLSQGHSDAVRRVNGVKHAVQYTIPVEEAIARVRAGEKPNFTARDMHKRECWVVAEENADIEAIRREIINMPNYFAEYDTTVNFISEADFMANHNGMPHGGFVVRSGCTGENLASANLIEFSLKLDSNPEFTACAISAYARAAFRMAAKGECGAKTVFDVPPALLSPCSSEELRSRLL